MARAYRPRARVYQEPAPWNPAGLYWTVQTRTDRIYVGPAQGPASHIHYDQAVRLAKAIDPRADVTGNRPRTRRRPTTRPEPSRPANQGSVRYGTS